MGWELWARGPVERTLDSVWPLLASWEKSTRPAQARLQAYLEEVTRGLSPLPEAPHLYLHMDIDVEEPERLLRHYDLENYLTPLFGRRWLPPERFALVSARKRVGGGSHIECGPAERRARAVGEWSHFAMNAGSGATERRWKENLARLGESSPRPVPPGPAAVRLAWRCSSKRNWTMLWKTTGDAMGPVLGVADPRQPFNPNDDRIVDLELHRVADDSLGHDVVVEMWWRAA